MTRYELKTRGVVQPKGSQPITFFMKRAGRVVDIERSPNVQLVRVTLGRARVDLREGVPAEVLTREPREVAAGSIIVITAKNVGKKPAPLEVVIAIEGESGVEVAPPPTFTFAHRKVVRDRAVHGTTAEDLGKDQGEKESSTSMLRLAPSPADAQQLVREQAVMPREVQAAQTQDEPDQESMTVAEAAPDQDEPDQGEFCPIDAARVRRAALSKGAGEVALYMMTPGLRRALVKVLETKGRTPFFSKGDRAALIVTLRAAKRNGAPVRKGYVAVALDRALAARLRDRLLKMQETRISQDDRAAALSSLAPPASFDADSAQSPVLSAAKAAQDLSEPAQEPFFDERVLALVPDAAQTAPNQDDDAERAEGRAKPGRHLKDQDGEGRRPEDEDGEGRLTNEDAEGRPNDDDAEGHLKEEREAS